MITIKPHSISPSAPQITRISLLDPHLVNCTHVLSLILACWSNDLGGKCMCHLGTFHYGESNTSKRPTSYYTAHKPGQHVAGSKSSQVLAKRNPFKLDPYFQQWP
jgi:hypothetical protein